MERNFSLPPVSKTAIRLSKELHISESLVPVVRIPSEENMAKWDRDIEERSRETKPCRPRNTTLTERMEDGCVTDIDSCLPWDG